MATHSSTLTWKMPWTEDPGRPQFRGSQRVGHDWATSLFTFLLKEKTTVTVHHGLRWRESGTAPAWGGSSDTFQRCLSRSLVQGTPQPHSCVLGFSLVVPCPSIVASGSSCEGCEIRNTLCRHLGDVTPLFFLTLSLSTVSQTSAFRALPSQFLKFFLSDYFVLHSTLPTYSWGHT